VSEIRVGLGEFAVSVEKGGGIKTFGLGSCVAVVAYHLRTGTVGMAHIVLPDSTGSVRGASFLPGRFADSGIPALFDEMNRVTGTKGRYVVKLIGGASVLIVSPGERKIDIGKKNILATKKAMWKRGLGALAEDLGGCKSRTVSISVGSPDVSILTGGSLRSVL